jgi:hypothetical protein
MDHTSFVEIAVGQKDNLLKNQSASEKEKNKNLINKTDLANTIAEDFLSRAISHIKNIFLRKPECFTC